MPNKYLFNGEEFTTQENCLLIKNAYNPVKMYLKKVTKLYTEDLPMDLANSYGKRLTGILDKERQDQKDLEIELEAKSANKELIAKLKKEIKNNKANLEKLNAEYAKDTEAKKQQADFDEACQGAIEQTFSTVSIVTPFLEKYLIGDVSKLDFTNPEILDFIDKVMGDFFLWIQQNKIRL